MPSKLEIKFIDQLRDTALPSPVREYRFHPTRKWLLDFAWPQRWPPVAVEIEGGIWARGRHTRGAGYTEDCEKYNAAILAGWVLLRFTDEHLKSGYALETLRRALEL